MNARGLPRRMLRKGTWLIFHGQGNPFTCAIAVTRRPVSVRQRWPRGELSFLVNKLAWPGIGLPGERPRHLEELTDVS